MWFDRGNCRPRCVGEHNERGLLQLPGLFQPPRPQCLEQVLVHLRRALRAATDLTLRHAGQRTATDAASARASGTSATLPAPARCLLVASTGVRGQHTVQEPAGLADATTTRSP